MDFVWIAALAAMWAVTAAMAWALGRLEAAKGERS
jgi:hypothetical protein